MPRRKKTPEVVRVALTDEAPKAAAPSVEIEQPKPVQPDPVAPTDTVQASPTVEISLRTGKPKRKYTRRTPVPPKTETIPAPPPAAAEPSQRNAIAPPPPSDSITAPVVEVAVQGPARARMRGDHFADKVPVKSQTELLEPRTFDRDPAHVKVQMGVTLNLGNFEFARIDVGLALPCALSDKDGGYKEAYEFVEKRLSDEVDKLRARATGVF